MFGLGSNPWQVYFFLNSNNKNLVMGTLGEWVEMEFFMEEGVVCVGRKSSQQFFGVTPMCKSQLK